MRKLLGTLGIALVCLLVAGMASAGEGTWYRCGSTKKAKSTIGPGVASCYGIDNTDSDSKSKTFYVVDTALICLDPDTATDGADAAEVMILRCPAGLGDNAPSDELCIDILDAPLDGTAGAAATQNACVRVARGSFWIEVTTVPAASDTTVISVEGE